MIDIKQGATFQGGASYAGVPFMAVGLIMGIGAALHNWPWLLLALPLFAIGLIIFMVRKATLIDPASNRFQPYQDFLLFKAGPWIALESISSVRVKRERETYSHDPAGAGIMRNRTSFWCFNVTLHGSGLVNVVFLKEFYEAKPALALGKQLAETLRITLEDVTQARPDRSHGRR